ncbi:ATP-binding protein [Methylomonas rapida]|uniref:ATP-binding protein n=1 Tax=Methylomonas rapida TaxID=2963939 RepID=A0ABY7GNE0_9GAMM|nr:ATP-binding protein [Methylomonas rapida]WAR46018.1 ATP-binding protein [Methylomonas rapida]
MGSFALTRLILIDSYKPGTLQEVRLDGHTNLNGVNGAGKTTLLRLIPLFFGERPGRLVPKSKVTDSFAKHYLPNESSYIIFEYRRDQQICLVVIYASLNEEGLCYRFVDKGFDRDDFLETRLDGSCYPISCRDLKRHLDKRHINCSNQLTSCSDYRTVIQNLPHSKGQELRNLIARYSFCQGSAGRRLKDIEKIVSGMLQRSTDFADLREMLVNCIDENRDSISLDISMDKLEDWYKEYRAYQHSEAEREQAAELSELAAEQEQFKTRFGELHKRLLLLRERYRQQQQGQQERLANTEQSLRTVKSDWETQEQEMQSALARQRAELTSLDKQKTQLENEKAEWDAKDIQRSIRLAEQQPVFADNLAREQQHYEKLTSEVQDINAQFSAIKADTEKGYAEQRYQYERQIQEVRAEASQDEAKHRAEHNQVREQLRAANNGEQEKLHGSAGEVQGKLGALNAQIAQIQPDPELLQTREAKLELQQSLQLKLEEAKTEVAGINKRIKANQDEVESVLEQKRHHQTEKQSIDEAISRLKRQLDTEADTLLRFLREHQPGWTQDIAKVVNPELLLRDDLEPVLVEKPTGFYGVSLNLDVLSADLAADEQQIRALLSEHEHRLRELAGLDEQADQQLTALKKTDSQLRKQSQQAESEQGRLQTSLKGIQNELASLKLQIENSKRQRGQQLQSEKIAVEQTLADTKRQLEGLKRQLQDDEKQLAVELETVITRIKQTAEQQVEHVRQDIASLNSQEQQALQQLEQQRINSLKTRQIDVDALQQLEVRIDTLKKQLQTAKTAAETVSEYRRWEQLHWSGYAQLCSAARELTAELRQTEAQFAAAKQRYQQCSSELKAEQGRLITALQKLDQEMKTLEQLLDDCTPYARYAPNVVSFDESHTLALLQNEYRALSEAYKNQRRMLLAKLRHLKQTLARYPSTRPAQYYASQENELGLDIDETAWLSPILHWYDTAYQDLHSWLVNQANLFGSMIRDYQQTLEKFDRGIDSLSRRLTKHIDSNIRFDKIESVQGRLTSKVQSLGYWQQIVAFTKQYDDWNRNSDGCLPGESFAEMVRLVAEQMSGKGRVEMKLVSLLELEIIVSENGRSKRATHAEELQQISSHGLSYLILCVFFIALVNMIRKDQPLNIIWPMDELKELHQVNIEVLLELLSNNGITLLSAFPDPDPDVLRLFKNRYQVVGQRELVEMEIDDAYLAELAPMVRELANV